MEDLKGAKGVKGRRTDDSRNRFSMSRRETPRPRNGILGEGMTKKPVRIDFRGSACGRPAVPGFIVGSSRDTGNRHRLEVDTGVRVGI
jgi:hypothetical protein